MLQPAGLKCSRNIFQSPQIIGPNLSKVAETSEKITPFQKALKRPLQGLMNAMPVQDQIRHVNMPWEVWHGSKLKENLRKSLFLQELHRRAPPCLGALKWC
jgi:hypothetical protein